MASRPVTRPKTKQFPAGETESVAHMEGTTLLKIDELANSSKQKARECVRGWILSIPANGGGNAD